MGEFHNDEGDRACSIEYRTNDTQSSLVIYYVECHGVDEVSVVSFALEEQSFVSGLIEWMSMQSLTHSSKLGTL